MFQCLFPLREQGLIVLSYFESEMRITKNSIPLSRFVDLNPSFNLGNLQTIRFLFDPSSSGVVLVDDIGIDKKL
jgi:hypothetical protein